ncbi:MAG: serine kinase [Anaerolineae bacterium]|nr:serine kinase [Anaerolineae bacterium]
MNHQTNPSKTLSRRIQPNPAAFFETVYQAFQNAEQAVGSSIDRYYSIDGHTIRLRFAGPALVDDLTPALEHHATPPTSAPALTICIWDSMSTQTEWPSFPWWEYFMHVNSNGEKVSNLYTPRGDIRGYNDGRIYTHIGADLFSILDIKQNIAVYWCQDAAQLPLYEKGAPVRTILHWWLRDKGLQLLHAGAIGTPDGAVLLAGKGGSGKSTTALTGLQSDLLYLSDDYSLVKLGSPPHVYSLYNTAKVRPDNLKRVPHLHHALTNANRLETEKALFFIGQHYPDKIVSDLPIRAILLPKVTGLPDTTIEPAGAKEALSSLALSSLHQLAGSGKALIHTINQLVNQVPIYHLKLGTELDQIPMVISDVIARESAP